MSNINGQAIGIIFPNSYDALMPELTKVRLMASVPFASRYRMIDFVLSGMSNSGINNIYVMVNKNYQSLMDHLGSGREWDLVRKGGGLHVFPPYAVGTSKPYTGRVGALAGLLDFLRGQKEKYVIISDSNIAYNLDFGELIEAHEKTGADVTVVYKEEALSESILNSTDNTKGFFYTFDIEDGRIKYIYVNHRATGIQNFSMNVYVMNRELLIGEITTAYVRGMEYFERDVLLPSVNRLNIQGYNYKGYSARMCGLKSYFDENMKLLEDGNLEALFGAAPVYTKIRDDNPTRYEQGCKVENIMAADGCTIEGEVSNSVLFRGVKIGKGAVVKNCVLLQDTVVEPGAVLEYVVTDKDVKVSADKELKGVSSYPIYVDKGSRI